MNPIKTGIIGLGYWGPNLLRNFAAQNECEMIYACDLNEQRLMDVKKNYPSIRCTTSATELLEDPSLELVLIATPTATHYKLAKQALECNKHVFVEKPITMDPSEAESLVALAQIQKRHLFVDHTFVFAPAVQHLRTLAQNGTIGTLLYFDSTRVNLGLIQRDTNALYDLAVHDLSILHTIRGLDDVRNITAHGSKHFGQQEEQAHLHLTFEDGCVAHIHVSWLSPVKIRQTILAGTASMAIYDDTHPSEKVRIYDKGIDHDPSKPDPFFPKYRSGDIHIPALPTEETLAIEARHIIRCIREEEQALVSGSDGTSIVRLLNLANRSLQEGRTISLHE